MRFCFARLDELKYLSHLDLVRLFLRALRRSGLPLDYSRGFNPHPRFNLALPLPLGVTASEECGELCFGEPVDPSRFLEALRPQLPQGLELFSAAVVDQALPALPAEVAAALYLMYPAPGEEAAVDAGQLKAALDRLLGKKEIILTRPGKKKKPVSSDVRPLIIEASVEEKRSLPPFVKMMLRVGSGGGAGPVPIFGELLKELPAPVPDLSRFTLHREKLYALEGKTFQPLSERM